jgi:outer membrane immunogenic protein
MRRGVIATTAALAVSANAAAAADVYRNPYAPNYTTATTTYSWTGAYLGGTFGYQWGELSNSGAEPHGVTGGFEGGYNWQYGMFVVGGETDLQLSNASDTFADYKFSNPWFGTVRGRAGFAMNNILFYGTLGLAYGQGHVDLGIIGEDNMHFGWTTGLGLEVGLTQNWSVKAEYLYIDLSNDNYGLIGTNLGLTSSVGRFGLNYRF